MAEPAFRLPKINIPTASAKQIEDQTSNPAALFDIVGSLKTNPPITGKPVMITKAQYQAQATQGYNRIPLVQELLADLDTPLSLYLKLANRPFSYLLESVVGGERFGRYSFIGLPCRDYIKVSGSRTEIYQDHRLVQTHHGNPPHIIIHGTRTTNVPASYTTYLSKFFREHFKLHGTPVRISYRDKANPYRDK